MWSLRHMHKFLGACVSLGQPFHIMFTQNTNILWNLCFNLKFATIIKPKKKLCDFFTKFKKTWLGECTTNSKSYYMSWTRTNFTSLSQHFPKSIELLYPPIQMQGKYSRILPSFLATFQLHSETCFHSTEMWTCEHIVLHWHVPLSS